MESALRTPHLSEPLQLPNAARRPDSFGYSWPEVVTRVEAFWFHLSNGRIDKIENVTHDEIRSSLERSRVDIPMHLFILFPGESVSKVELLHSETAITAIKLHTTKRQTPWLGGPGCRRSVFEPNEGFCINAFYGQYGPEGRISQLGVVHAPSAIAWEGHSLAIPSETSSVVDVGEEVAPQHRYQFCTFSPIPRAIVVRLSDKGVVGLRVVTAAEFEMLFDRP